MAKYKTYAKEKWLYFVLAVTAYFLPFTIVTVCLLPMIDTSGGFKIAMGLGIVLINSIPFIMGIFKAFFAHFPMFNMLSAVFLFLAAFFTLDVFRTCVDKLLWIELSAALGSVASCVFWALYRKYSKWHESVKANIKCGAFIMKGENGDD